MVQLVFEAIAQIEPDQRHKKIYIISSDTMVETPLIISLINRSLIKIQEKALALGLPIETHKVKPDLEKTFWVSLLGKGYPPPRQKFRWCTDRMKIEPANTFILEKVSQFGEIIMVLGVRDSESATRAQVMDTHSIAGKILMKHSTLPNAYVFAPIREFTTDDVWNYLIDYNQGKTPWDTDNHELKALYKNSAGGECPLIIDKKIKETAGSCGNSRFGCWVCTVVSEDRAINGFIETGEEWLRPLAIYRKKLIEYRENRDKREKHRMDGSIYFVGEGEGRELGLGPFTLNARKELMHMLLVTQRDLRNPYDPDYKLIQDTELKMIRKLWIEDGDWEDSLPFIYKDVFGEDLDWEYDDRPLFEEEQITDLELLCSEHDVDFELIKRLIQIEKKHVGYKVRRGVIQDFERILNQDKYHYGIVEGFKNEI